MDVRKATRQDLKLHNRLTLLRSIYYGLADNRAALAQVTGLAKPTVSDLISELIDEGLLVEGGQGEAAEQGGKRPRLLHFVPDARQVIGISMDAHRVTGVLSNLAGRIIAEHYALLHHATGEAVIDVLTDVINGLIAQLDAPLLCIGIGVPGIVDSGAGIVQRAALLGWQHVPLAERLIALYECPVYVANNTELVALAQVAFRAEAVDTAHNLVTLLVNNATGIGAALHGAQYHHGSDIGLLRMKPDAPPLDAFLGWRYVQERIKTLREFYPDTMLPADDLTYMHIRFAAANGDPLALTLYDELSESLAQVVAWAVALLRPHHVSLAGEIADLDQPLIDRVRAKAAALLTPEQVENVTFSLAESGELSAIGAVAHAIHNELDLL